MSAAKAFRSFPFTAPEQAWVLGGKTKLTFKDFVEVTCENEKRTIIDGFEIFCRANVSNGVGDSGDSDEALNGEDLLRIFRSVTVEQKDGVKRYDEVSGDALRICQYAFMGATKVREHQDVAVTTDDSTDTPVVVIVSAYVPMRKNYVSGDHADGMGSYDYSLPADSFNLIRIGMGQNADLSIDDVVMTINSAQYWVSADCHAEDTARTYAVDTISQADFDSTLQTKINVSGRIHDLFLYVPGEQGGVRLTGIDQVMLVDIYQQSQLVYPDLVTRYARERGVCEGLAGSQGYPWRTDPFVPEQGAYSAGVGSPRAIAALLSTGNHPDEGQVRGNLTIKLTESSNPATGSNGTASAVRVVYRVIEQRSDKLDAAQAHKFGATGVVPDRDPGKKKIAPRDAKYFPGRLTR